MTNPPFVLEARRLCFAYPDRADALVGASLGIRAGVRLALLGANGAGKSTLLLHLNGTLRPRAGELLHAGHPVRYTRTDLNRLRQEVAIVLQDPDDQLFAGTVRQDVAFGPLNLGLGQEEARARVETALAVMGITDLGDLPPHQLSHGQRKRAAIAGALAMHPRILALDEPTAGLDPDGVDALLDQLEALHRLGVALIVSTHDVNFACGWATEVAIMQRGAIVGTGVPSEVMTDAALMRRTGLRVPAMITRDPFRAKLS